MMDEQGPARHKARGGVKTGGSARKKRNNYPSNVEVKGVGDVNVEGLEQRRAHFGMDRLQRGGL